MTNLTDSFNKQAHLTKSFQQIYCMLPAQQCRCQGRCKVCSYLVEKVKYIPNKGADIFLRGFASEYYTEGCHVARNMTSVQ